MRRQADTQNTALVIVGALLCIAGVALKAFAGASDTLVIVLVLVGAAMVPGSHVLDLVRAWRKNGGPRGPA
jgi:uncharacterized membrane protein